MNFQDKVVVITGAGAGIGLATAKKYAQHGAKLVLNSIVPAEEQCARAEIAAAAPDAELEFVVGNVAEEADCARIIDTAVRRFGRVDILCNIAGIVHSGTLLTTSEDDFVRTMDVNVKGTFLMMKHAVEAMKETGGGVIVNIASVAAIKGHLERCAYSASKGAVISLSKSVAADFVRDNIRVNVVCPGTTLTPSLRDRIAAAPDPAEMERRFTARQPMGRLGKVEEIAESILFVSCDEAAYMTGSVLTIDGGMTC